MIIKEDFLKIICNWERIKEFKYLIVSLCCFVFMIKLIYKKISYF